MQHETVDKKGISSPISREEASGAGLLVALLFFALAVGAFVAVNVYWPASQEITNSAPTNSNQEAPKHTTK